MTERVFWCESITLGEHILDEAESRHARTSLRLEPGQPLTLLDGAGRIGHAIVQAAGDRKRDAGLRVQIERIESVERPSRRLTLIVAACKGERLDWLVEKCTEQGVDRLWITTFERSVAEPGLGRLDRLERLTHQACKQCRRAWVPELRCNVPLADAVVTFRSAAHSMFVAHPDPDAASLSRAIGDSAAGETDVAVVIGPEGGLTDAELSRLHAAGARRVRLATHVLRVETAALAAAAIWSDAQQT